jgi:hypothetical protein
MRETRGEGGLAMHGDAMLRLRPGRVGGGSDEERRGREGADADAGEKIVKHGFRSSVLGSAKRGQEDR